MVIKRGGMTTRKLLICNDSNPRAVSDIVTNISTYELMPFDGQTATMILVDPVLGGIVTHNNMWAGSSWDWSLASTPIANILATKYNRFFHNFFSAKCVVPTIYNNPPVDWFDPAFQSVIDNFCFLTRVCLASNGLFKGVWFDPEAALTAGARIFDYADRPQSGTYTRTQYETQVNLCGKLIIEAMQRVMPNVKLMLAFGMEQASKSGTMPHYDLLDVFLDGIFQNISYPAEIHNMFEDGYGHYQSNQFTEDIQDVRDPVGSPRVNKAPGTSRYYGAINKGNSIWVDYIDGSFPSFNTGNNLLNYFTAARFQSAVELMFPYSTSLGNEIDTYGSVYSQAVSWCIPSPTIPTVYVQALNAARVTLGWDQAFNPLIMPGIKNYFNPLTMGLSDSTAIASYTDVKGVVYTQPSGAAQPVFRTTAGMNGHASVRFTAASSQFLIADALAAFFTGADKPITIVCAIQLIATGVYYTIVSCGGSGTNSPAIDFRATSSPNWSVQRSDDAASSGTLNSAGGVVTTPAILSFISNGINGTIRVNGTDNPVSSAQDVGAMTLNQFTLGAKRVAANTQFADMYMGAQVTFNNALGLDEVRYLERGFANQYGITLTGG